MFWAMLIIMEPTISVLTKRLALAGLAVGIQMFLVKNANEVEGETDRFKKVPPLENRFIKECFIAAFGAFLVPTFAGLLPSPSLALENSGRAYKLMQQETVYFLGGLLLVTRDRADLITPQKSIPTHSHRSSFRNHTFNITFYRSYELAVI